MKSKEVKETTATQTDQVTISTSDMFDATNEETQASYWFKID